MLSTAIYKLLPSAPLLDHNWQRAMCQGEIVVRARSGGEARAIAARAEARAAGASAKTTGQVTASAFRDSTLYSARRDDSGRFPNDGPLEVISGSFQVPSGWVAHHD
ncbi:MAG TPA: hypothetical protein VN541_21065 [Tepidisphaeraceae bacterium]|jgi:hypothetical protein|nr:hypothetical protein [Tepidisphaeraceae bacterium]